MRDSDSEAGFYQSQRCKLCKKTFTRSIVTVDGKVAEKYYKLVAKAVSTSRVALTKTSTHRIGGKSTERYRRVSTGYAMEYCKVAKELTLDFQCVVAENFEGSKTKPITPMGLIISSPTDESSVTPRSPISGSFREDETLSEGKIVWVIIKPDNDYFWVQRPARVSKGRWRSEACFGDAYTPDGHYFLVYAVVGPGIVLEVGDLLRALPSSIFVSNSIGVILKRLT